MNGFPMPRSPSAAVAAASTSRLQNLLVEPDREVKSPFHDGHDSQLAEVGGCVR